MNQEWKVGVDWGHGCARHTMKSIESWGSKSSTVGNGKRGGGLGGKTEDAIKGATNINHSMYIKCI